MISKQDVITKYTGKIDLAIVEAVLYVYGDAVNEKEIDEQLKYLVVPSVASQPSGINIAENVNKTFPEVELSTGQTLHANFLYVNKFTGRLIAVYAETRSQELGQVLSPSKTFPVKVAFGQSTRIRLTFTTSACSGFHTVVEVLLKDAFTGRLLERLNFAVVVK